MPCRLRRVVSVTKTHASRCRRCRGLSCPVSQTRELLASLNCWNPGQVTPYHRHGEGNKAWVRVVSGHMLLTQRGEHLRSLELRISLALPARSFTPGIGVKLFIDGHPSVNTVAMHSLKGQGDDCNVFSESNDNPASAEFAGLPMRILYYFFKRTADALKADAPRMEWFYMPFDEWGRWRADGTEESEVHCPYGVSFAPAEAQTSRDKTPDFRLKLRQIEAGTRLFRVMAFDANEAKAQKHIGDMISTTPFVASSYGDQKLFFQHLKGDPG